MKTFTVGTRKLALSTALFSLLAIAPHSAKAADLGGDCCADLEERVAELEATTVRKGNRNISVSLYGQVNQGILWYDNGEESDIYVADMDLSTSRFGFTGSADIKPGWSISYTLEIGTGASILSGLTENDGDDGGDDIAIRKSSWSISSEQMGTLSVGQNESAADGVTEADLGGASGWHAYNGHSDWIFSFGIHDSAANAYSGVIWGDIMGSFDPGRQNRIRYDTPTFGGFVASASWGEDDTWAVALRFSSEWNGVEVAAAVGYDVNRDEGAETDTIGASASVYHSSSGLFVTVAYGNLDFNVVGTNDAVNYYVKAGIRGSWSALGETALYGEYGKTEDLFAAGTSGQIWGFGVGQEIDAVGGATMYLGYRHHEADLTAVGVNADDMQAIVSGMIVPF